MCSQSIRRSSKFQSILCQERHVLHRDLKSGNFFICRSGNLKMGDFGIAKAGGHIGQSASPMSCMVSIWNGINQWMNEAKSIHPASRGVAAHTAGLFRSVRGAKGGFPPWGLPKLGNFHFSPPWGLPKLGNFHFSPPWGLPKLGNFNFSPPWGLPKLGNFHFSPPWGLPKLGNFHFSPPWQLPKLLNFHFSLPWSAKFHKPSTLTGDLYFILWP